MKSAIRGLSAAVLFGMMSVGCASTHQEGVTSNYHAQWIDVTADVETTTKAANDVFTSDNLTSISMKSDKVTGEASGDTADGRKIYASVKQNEAGTGSQLSIQVGKIGDPTVGAKYAGRIKQAAEGNKKM